MAVQFETKQADALRQALSYPLVEALIHRRSRRFSLGARMPGGGLAYESTHAPVPLTKWSTNLPGTTYFLPVSDLSGMYINVALSAFDEQMTAFVLDERNTFRPAGIKKFGKSKGGRLHDNPDDGRVVSVLGLEAVIIE